MVVKKITYKDYYGNERTEEFMFNYNEAELTEMQFSEAGGFKEMIERMAAAQDNPMIMKTFKDIILSSYGEVSPDGKYFIKVRNGERLADLFCQTDAYNQLFIELTSDNGKKLADFINALVPESLKEASKAVNA